MPVRDYFTENIATLFHLLCGTHKNRYQASKFVGCFDFRLRPLGMRQLNPLVCLHIFSSVLPSEQFQMQTENATLSRLKISIPKVLLGQNIHQSWQESTLSPLHNTKSLASVDLVMLVLRLNNDYGSDHYDQVAQLKRQNQQDSQPSLLFLLEQRCCVALCGVL